MLFVLLLFAAAACQTAAQVTIAAAPSSAVVDALCSPVVIVTNLSHTSFSVVNIRDSVRFVAPSSFVSSAIFMRNCSVVLLSTCGEAEAVSFIIDATAIIWNTNITAAADVITGTVRVAGNLSHTGIMGLGPTRLPGLISGAAFRSTSIGGLSVAYSALTVSALGSNSTIHAVARCGGSSLLITDTVDTNAAIVAEGFTSLSTLALTVRGATINVSDRLAASCFTITTPPNVRAANTASPTAAFFSVSRVFTTSITNVNSLSVSYSGDRSSSLSRLSRSSTIAPKQAAGPRSNSFSPTPRDSRSISISAPLSMSRSSSPTAVSTFSIAVTLQGARMSFYFTIQRNVNLNVALLSGNSSVEVRSAMPATTPQLADLTVSTAQPGHLIARLDASDVLLRPRLLSSGASVTVLPANVTSCGFSTAAIAAGSTIAGASLVIYGAASLLLRGDVTGGGRFTCADIDARACRMVPFNVSVPRGGTATWSNATITLRPSVLGAVNLSSVAMTSGTEVLFTSSQVASSVSSSVLWISRDTSVSGSRIDFAPFSGSASIFIDGRSFTAPRNMLRVSLPTSTASVVVSISHARHANISATGSACFTATLTGTMDAAVITLSGARNVTAAGAVLLSTTAIHLGEGRCLSTANPLVLSGMTLTGAALTLSYVGRPVEIVAELATIPSSCTILGTSSVVVQLTSSSSQVATLSVLLSTSTTALTVRSLQRISLSVSGVCYALSVVGALVSSRLSFLGASLLTIGPQAWLRSDSSITVAENAAVCTTALLFMVSPDCRIEASQLVVGPFALQPLNVACSIRASSVAFLTPTSFAVLNGSRFTEGVGITTTIAAGGALSVMGLVSSTVVATAVGCAAVTVGGGSITSSTLSLQGAFSIVAFQDSMLLSASSVTVTVAATCSQATFVISSQSTWFNSLLQLISLGTSSDITMQGGFSFSSVSISSAASVSIYAARFTNTTVAASTAGKAVLQHVGQGTSVSITSTAACAAAAPWGIDIDGSLNGNHYVFLSQLPVRISAGASFVDASSVRITAPANGVCQNFGLIVAVGSVRIAYVKLFHMIYPSSSVTFTATGAHFGTGTVIEKSNVVLDFLNVNAAETYSAIWSARTTETNVTVTAPSSLQLSLTITENIASRTVWQLHDGAGKMRIIGLAALTLSGQSSFLLTGASLSSAIYFSLVDSSIVALPPFLDGNELRTTVHYLAVRGPSVVDLSAGSTYSYPDSCFSACGCNATSSSCSGCDFSMTLTSAKLQGGGPHLKLKAPGATVVIQSLSNVVLSIASSKVTIQGALVDTTVSFSLAAAVLCNASSSTCCSVSDALNTTGAAVERSAINIGPSPAASMAAFLGSCFTYVASVASFTITATCSPSPTSVDICVNGASRSNITVSSPTSCVLLRVHPTQGDGTSLSVAGEWASVMNGTYAAATQTVVVASHLDRFASSVTLQAGASFLGRFTSVASASLGVVGVFTPVIQGYASFTLQGFASSFALPLTVVGSSVASHGRLIIDMPAGDVALLDVSSTEAVVSVTAGRFTGLGAWTAATVVVNVVSDAAALNSITRKRVVLLSPSPLPTRAH